MTDREALRTAARDVCGRLIPPPIGIRLRPAIILRNSYTKGWRVELAGMGAGKPRLELWFDRWADPRKRRFWYGFYSRQPSKLKAITKRLPSYLQPKHSFTDEDVENVDRYNSVLRQPLRAREYGTPFDEKYKDGTFFYGKFDPASPDKLKSIDLIVHRAAAFFRDVLEHQRQQRNINGSDEEVYPRENRKVVRLHLVRERSSALATECKIRDRYRCQVCGKTFEEVYGDIGKGFAEAHHIVPLHRLGKTVESFPKDLITVCSNCHRMLHKMPSKSGDIQKLKRLIK